MTSEEIRQAEEKLEKIMVMFFYEDPILLQAFCLLKKVPDPEQDTLGINLEHRHPRLTYNPNFVNITHPEVLETIMISEGLRILLRHVSSRLKEPRSIAHMSSDMSICSLMNSDITKLLDGVAVSEFLMAPSTFGFEEQKAHEEYFRMLIEQMDKVTQHIQEMWPENEDGEGQGQGMSMGDGDGESEGGEGEGDGGKRFKEYDNQKDALHDYKNPMGTGAQGWGDDSDEHFDVALSTVIGDNKNSAKNWGKFTGGMKTNIIAAFTPKVNPKDVLKRFYKSVTAASTENTRMKVNRRFDIMQPGRRRTYKTKVVFAIDVSGSMGDDDIAEGLSVVNACLKHAEILFVTFDTQITEVVGTLKKAKKTFKVKGRGGTDFNEVIEFAQKENCDGLIIFTDGEASPPPKPKKLKVCWLMDNDKHTPPVDWGAVVKLNRHCDYHW